MAPETFTFEDAKRILVDRIGVPEEKVVDDPALSFDELGLDSLALVDVQLAVQQEYGFEIPDEDGAQIQTLGSAIEYVNRRLAETV
jgi:acyl carrier protein